MSSEIMAATSTLAIKDQHLTTIHQLRAAALEVTRKKQKTARKVIPVVKQARKAKETGPAKSKATSKKLPSAKPAPASWSCQCEEDDEEIVSKSEPLADAGNSQQVGPSSASTTAMSNVLIAPSEARSTLPTVQPTLNPKSPLKTQRTSHASRSGPESKDMRKMALMLELKRIEVEKKQVELRELETQQKIMQLEYEN